MLPDPVIERVGHLVVVRDDLLPGGTKRRALPAILSAGKEYVYGGPAYGYGQVALAYACRDIGAQATVFVAKRSSPHPHTIAAARAGAKVVQVPFGYLSNVRSKAKLYADSVGAENLPLGFNSPSFVAALSDIANRLPIRPDVVWSVAGTGTLSRALQAVWSTSEFHAVRIGMDTDAGLASVIVAPEKFEQSAKHPPPFPSCANYDAKAWRFIPKSVSALFWNVAA